MVKGGVCYDINAAPASPPRDPGQNNAALRGIRWAGIVLVVGLVLEVASTLWTFQKSLAAGALYNGDLNCANDGRLQTLHKSFLAQEACDEIPSVDKEPFLLYESSYDNIGPDIHVVFPPHGECENITGDTPAGQDDFLTRCTCDRELTVVAPCRWYPVFDHGSDMCYAYALSASNDSYPNFDYAPHDWGVSNTYSCRPKVPSGTYQLSITSLIVALGSQLVEAVTGFKYLVSPRRSPALMTAVSAFEALGVSAVAAVIVALPGFFGDDFFGLERAQRDLVFWFTWASAAVAIVGAVVEWAAERPDRWGRRRPNLGVLGNALVWLGAATLEVVVAAFQTWRVTLSPGGAVFFNEMAGLVAMEVAALVSMWTARFLWTVSKEMLSPVLTGSSLHFARRKRGAALI